MLVGGWCVCDGDVLSGCIYGNHPRVRWQETKNRVACCITHKLSSTCPPRPTNTWQAMMQTLTNHQRSMRGRAPAGMYGTLSCWSSCTTQQQQRQQQQQQCHKVTLTSKICAPLYEATVLMPILAITLRMPTPTALGVHTQHTGATSMACKILAKQNLHCRNRDR